LATPFAAVRFSEYAEFEDGSASAPDPCDFAYSDETAEPASGELCSPHRVGVLDQAIPDLPAPDLKPDSEVFLSGPLSVRDAFFFRGV
jgi:hypothetical protein